MPNAYESRCAELEQSPRTWLVTGVAGFIGSNLLQQLLSLGQHVVGLDNLATGHRKNLEEVEGQVSSEAWGRFRYIDADIRDLEACQAAASGVDYVLHQAALGSVPRSINDPITSNAANITGFLNMLVAARDAGVSGFVYAASSSTYGDHPDLPKVEDRIGKPLSPYAVTKYVNELYADVFARTYGFGSVGLRYFNVFGPRQDPDGAYAAVIPRWAAAMIRGDQVAINGDGETSRDFCYVANVVQANILAATAGVSSEGLVCNIARGERTTLNELFELIRDALGRRGVSYSQSPAYGDFRPGDVRHSLADISRAHSRLGYSPSHDVREGIEEAMDWYRASL